MFFFPSQKPQSSHPASLHASHATPSSLEQATKMDGRNAKGKWQAARTASWRRRARSLTSVSSTTTGGAVCSASAAAASSLGTEAQPILPVLLARRRGGGPAGAGSGELRRQGPTHRSSLAAVLHCAAIRAGAPSSRLPHPPLLPVWIKFARERIPRSDVREPQKSTSDRYLRAHRQSSRDNESTARPAAGPTQDLLRVSLGVGQLA